MKGYLLCLVYVAAIFVFSTDSFAQTAKQKTLSFNPSGDYHPLSLPSLETDKFIQFDLNVSRKGNRLFASGAVKGVQPRYKFRSTDISDKHLRFTTAVVEGVGYSFDGKFLGKGNFASQWSGVGLEMLKGTLRKIVNGKIVLETNSTFVYYPGC